MNGSKVVKAKAPSAEAQLKALVAGIKPEQQTLFRSVRKALRARFPSVNEMAYDYGHSLVIGYSPSEAGVDAIVAISAAAQGIRLFFNQGPKLPDPKNILLGSGKATRFIWIESPQTLKRPEVVAMIKAASSAAKGLAPKGSKGSLIIKQTAASKRQKQK